MAYKVVVDLTSASQKAAKEANPTQTPFAAPDPAVPDATLDSLPAPLREALRSIGWTKLMPVQASALPHLLEGRDLIVQSRTGSGKTGAFLLPLLETLDPAQPTTQALVLCPTRELARQIFDEFERLTQTQPESRRLRGVAVYGGTRYGPQLEAFRGGGAHLVIGTPGRVLDHLERRTLTLDKLRVLILDEADEMLSMGFYPDMRQLKRHLPRERTSAMFSATMPYQVQRVGQEFLRNPSYIAMAGGTIHVDVMAHRAYAVSPMERDRALVKLIEMENPSAAIIFANRRSEVEYLATFLRNFGYDADAISSNLTQPAREAVMGRLRRGTLRFLVATDVAARGIDISDLSHVIQYDVPQDREYYVHRAGRTARAGKTGVSLALITPQDQPGFREIVRKYDVPVEWREVPTDDEVAARVGERLTVLLEDRMRMKSNLERERLARFVPVIRELVEEGEPELLAMLLDEAYQRTLQAPPEIPEEPAPSERAPARDEEASARSGYDDDRPRYAEGPAGQRAASDAPPPDAPPKKKRKKKRKKAVEGGPEGTAAGIHPGPDAPGPDAPGSGDARTDENE